MSSDPEVVPLYADMFNAFKALNVTKVANIIPAHEAPSYYSRYLDLGFANKYDELLV